MNDLFHNPWFLFVVFGLMSIVSNYIFKRWLQPIFFKPPAAPVLDFIRLRNGMVKVKREAFAADEVSYTALLTANNLMPFTVIMHLCHLGSIELRDCLRYTRQWMDSDNPSEQETSKDRQRGLTIGSALFNYSIPESFVLLDRRTRLIYAQHLQQIKDRRSFTDWLLKEPTLFESQYSMTSGVEDSIGVTKANAKAFHDKHRQAITNILIDQVAGEEYPNIEAVVKNILYKLKENESSIVFQHYVRVEISLIIYDLGLVVPYNWMMVSALVDYINAYTNGGDPDATPDKPGLKLIINNQ